MKLIKSATLKTQHDENLHHHAGFLRIDNIVGFSLSLSLVTYSTNVVIYD